MTTQQCLESIRSYPRAEPRWRQAIGWVYQWLVLAPIGIAVGIALNFGAILLLMFLCVLLMLGLQDVVAYFKHVPAGPL